MIQPLTSRVYEYPTLDLLENYGGEKPRVDAEELMRNKDCTAITLNHQYP
jgi:hypothetical protein